MYSEIRGSKKPSNVLRVRNVLRVQKTLSPLSATKVLDNVETVQQSLKMTSLWALFRGSPVTLKQYIYQCVSSKFEVLKHGQWYNITLQPNTKTHMMHVQMYMFEKWCNPELVTMKYCMAALKSMSDFVNTSSYQPAMHDRFVNNKPWITSDKCPF